MRLENKREKKKKEIFKKKGRKRKIKKIKNPARWLLVRDVKVLVCGSVFLATWKIRHTFRAVGMNLAANGRAEKSEQFVSVSNTAYLVVRPMYK